MENEKERTTEDLLEELDNAEAAELTDDDLEGASGGGNINCICFEE
jgi:hypothetical protein